MITAILASLIWVVTGSLANAARDALPDLHWRTDRRCGLNCLYLILFKYGKEPDYDILSAEMPLTERGVSVADLVQVAEKFGLRLVALRAEASALGDLPLPAILHCRSVGEGGHYLVLLSINKDDTFTIFGCTTGRIKRLSQDEFYDLWTGVILVRSEDWHWGGLRGKVLVVGSGLLVLLVAARILGWRRGKMAREGAT